MKVSALRLSLLHLAPVAGDLAGNLRTLQAALSVAAARGAWLAITPELVLSGYLFPDADGGAWIQEQPDTWLRLVAATARQLQIAVLVGTAERDAATRHLHNSAFLIERTGSISRCCRKVNVAADGWSSPGAAVAPITWRRLSIGCLICADAYTPDIAASLREQGAEMLTSPANWAPGAWGPNGEWEQRSRETGLPFIICNRTGRERKGIDFTRAESLVIVNGKRQLIHHSDQPSVLTFDLNPRSRGSCCHAFETDWLEHVHGSHVVYADRALLTRKRMRFTM